MPKLIFNLSDRQLNTLREASISLGVPMAECLRTAIDRQAWQGEPCGLVISGQIASGRLLLVRIEG